MTGSGGWPTTVFMTPEAKPFYAGTYFPPEPRHGIPSFPRAAAGGLGRPGASGATTSSVRPSGSTCALRTTASFRAVDGGLLTSSLLSGDAARGIVATFEPAYGGFGRAPKFPAASTLELLLRRGDERSLELVTTTLDGMAAGGFYDVVGGGFHRYSVDDRWLVAALREDALRQRRPRLDLSPRLGSDRAAAVSRDRRGDGGLHAARAPPRGRRAFASAHDADTDGVEGLTYTWTPEEADAVGPAARPARALRARATRGARRGRGRSCAPAWARRA